MDKDYVDGLYAAMENELSAIHQFPEQFSHSLSIISSSMLQLQKHIIAVGFGGDEEEIDFFKETKPRFYHWYIYLVEQHSILSGLAAGTEHMARDFYIKELSFVKRFFDLNAFVYQYYLALETCKDEEYFLRSRFVPALDRPVFQLEDFSTNQDYTFAKIMAYEKLQEFLVVRLRATYVAENGSIMAALRSGKKRTWTDEKIRLVELAYGIYFMGSVDFGKADISDIISALEEAFNIHLGVAYRRFVEISRRKSGSFTSYLDAMILKIVSHILDKDRYRPPAPKHLRNSGEDSRS